MNGRDIFRRSQDQDFDRLEEVVVRVTTWVSIVVFVFLIGVGLATGDSETLWQAINPATAAVTGIWMLAIGSPRVVVQLTASGVALAITIGFLEIGSRSSGLLGLLSMGIVGAVVVRRHTVLYMGSAALGVFGVAYWWNAGDWPVRQRTSEALAAALALVFAGGLVVWLKNQTIKEGLRRREADDALVASERQFRMAFETSAASVALLSVPDCRFIRVNQATCDMLGYTETELAAMTMIEVAHPDDRAVTRALLQEVMAGAVGGAQAEICYLKSDGLAYGLISAALVTDASGEPLHIVLQAVDTSEQHAAEKRLNELLQSRDQLIASVSHELRTPLTAVLGYAGLLQETTPGPPPEGYPDMVQEIVDQGSDLVGIIEDLLVFAQSDGPNLTVKPTRVNLGTQVALALESLKTQLEVERVHVVDNGVDAIADPLRVRQVLRNLLSNAGRYGGDDIAIELHDDVSDVVVVISDNGPGVPSQDRQRIFEAYQRAKPEEGLTAAIGVGLTVARRLARLMDGDVTYDYRDDRSVFELSLPRA
jgi:PAS domain S-box-containing protein